MGKFALFAVACAHSAVFTSGFDTTFSTDDFRRECQAVNQAFVACQFSNTCNFDDDDLAINFRDGESCANWRIAARKDGCGGACVAFDCPHAQCILDIARDSGGCDLQCPGGARFGPYKRAGLAGGSSSTSAAEEESYRTYYHLIVLSVVMACLDYM